MWSGPRFMTVRPRLHLANPLTGRYWLLNSKSTSKSTITGSSRLYFLPRSPSSQEDNLSSDNFDFSVGLLPLAAGCLRLPVNATPASLRPAPTSCVILYLSFTGWLVTWRLQLLNGDRLRLCAPTGPTTSGCLLSLSLIAEGEVDVCKLCTTKISNISRVISYKTEWKAEHQMWFNDIDSRNQIMTLVL